MDSPNAFGTNGLIKDGAKLVCCVDDIIEELNIGIDLEPVLKEIQRKPADLSADESALYNSIAKEPVELDELLEKTRLSGSRACELLLGLQLRRLIRQLPGQQFVRSG